MLANISLKYHLDGTISDCRSPLILKLHKMILHTNLKHIVDDKDHANAIESNENVMVCCGRMGPMCTPVYAAMKELENEYPQVDFRDMLFDNPYAAVIRDLPETRTFMGLPFVVYYKNGKVVKATSGIQSKEQIKQVLDSTFVNGSE
jgi:thioredoxin 1